MFVTLEVVLFYVSSFFMVYRLCCPSIFEDHFWLDSVILGIRGFVIDFLQFTDLVSHLLVHMLLDYYLEYCSLHYKKGLFNGEKIINLLLKFFMMKKISATIVAFWPTINGFNNNIHC